VVKRAMRDGVLPSASVPPAPLALAEWEAPEPMAGDLRILNAFFTPLYERHPEMHRADPRLQRWLNDLLGLRDNNDVPPLLEDLSDEVQLQYEQAYEGQVLVIGRKDGRLYVRYPRATGWVLIATLCARCGRATVFPITDSSGVFCHPVCRDNHVPRVLLTKWLRTLNKEVREHRDGIRAAVEERGQETWEQWLNRATLCVSGSYDVRYEVDGVTLLPGLDWPATTARQQALAGTTTHVVILVGGTELQRDRFDDWRIVRRAA
jgi:hypothetical protein